MDQLKKLFSFLGRNGFWILTTIIVCVSATGFWLARASLTSTIDSQTRAIEGEYDAISKLLAAASVHPNKYSHEKTNEEIGNLSNSVKEAWQTQFDRQKGILVWPEEALVPLDREKERETLRSLMPIEMTLEFPLKTEPLNQTQREVYGNYISRVFKKLADIVGAEWTAAELKRATGGYSGGGMPDMSSAMAERQMGSMSGVIKPVKVPVVIWEKESQEKLQKKICSWFNPDIPPNTMQIYYTQEDLWILEGILKIIKATNGDARENFQAAVKKIISIRMGQSAVGTAGVLASFKAASSTEGGASSYGDSIRAALALSEGGGVEDSASAANPYAGSAAFGGGAAVSPDGQDPADNRYVHADFKPIPGKDLREKMKSNDPKDAFYVVAKRIPVRMILTVDQKKLSKLLAECGNGAMILEVRQVRVNSEDAPEGAGGVAGGGGGGYTGGPTASAEEPIMTSGQTGGGRSGGTPTLPEPTHDIKVEIYGIVYLYNPVDMTKLGLENIKGDTILETTQSVSDEKKVEATSAQPQDDPAGQKGNPSGE